MKGYRTFIVNGAVVAAPLVGFLIDNGEVLASLLGPYGGQTLALLGTVNLVLRFITNTAVFNKE